MPTSWNTPPPLQTTHPLADMRASKEGTATISPASPELIAWMQEREAGQETRVTDPETGGMKGQKLARFDMIPPDVLWELAEHYGKGEAKYPSDETGLPNWQRGYSWRLSSAALQRHLFSWLMGEDTDPETDSSHLTAAIWHAIALRWFQLHGKGKDYR